MRKAHKRGKKTGIQSILLGRETSLSLLRLLQDSHELFSLRPLSTGTVR
jgi:hypothetical protein